MLILYLLTAGFVALSIWLRRAWKTRLNLKEKGVRATARCTGLTVLEGGVSLDFEFQVNGLKVSGESGNISTTRVVPGADVDILYDPEDPKRADLADEIDSSVRMYRTAFLFAAPLAYGSLIAEVCVTVAALL